MILVWLSFISLSFPILNFSIFEYTLEQVTSILAKISYTKFLLVPFLYFILYISYQFFQNFSLKNYRKESWIIYSSLILNLLHQFWLAFKQLLKIKFLFYEALSQPIDFFGSYFSGYAYFLCTLTSIFNLILTCYIFFYEEANLQCIKMEKKHFYIGIS